MSEHRRTLVRDLRKLTEKRVKVQGWVDVVRDQKTNQFVVVRDHTGLVQAFHKRGGREDAIASTISRLTRESAVEIAGTVKKNPAVKLGGLEVIIETLAVVSAAPSELPIDEHTGLEERLTWRFLDLRRPEARLIFEVQTTVLQAMRYFWTHNGFLELQTPKLMGSASESGAELFRVDYFGKPAYLAQSPQFYKQMAMAAGFDRVFEIGPAFRADPSFTTRHATEFTSVDMEMAWITSHEDVIAHTERWLAAVLADVRKVHGKKIKEAYGVEVVAPKVPFPRIPMAEARALLQKRGYQLPEHRAGDLDPEGERQLCAAVKDRAGHEFVFVTEYPIAVRPFYHLRPDSNPKVTNSFDLLWKGVELATGAQREHRYERLAKQAKEKGVSLEPIQYYLDFFRFGMPPHGGFGFGLNRFVMQLLGLKNVREATYLYRGPNRLVP